MFPSLQLRRCVALAIGLLGLFAMSASVFAECGDYVIVGAMGGAAAMEHTQQVGLDGMPVEFDTAIPVSSKKLPCSGPACRANDRVPTPGLPIEIDWVASENGFLVRFSLSADSRGKATFGENGHITALTGFPAMLWRPPRD
jgi:hypothetical protein